MPFAFLFDADVRGIEARHIFSGQFEVCLSILFRFKELPLWSSACRLELVADCSIRPMAVDRRFSPG